MGFDAKWSELRLGDLAISFAALIIIFYLIEPGKIIGILAKANAEFILAGAMLYFLLMSLMALRLLFILKFLGESISFARAFYANAAGLLASDLTPARAGYFVVPFLFERHDKIPLEKGMAAILGPQIFDFFLKSVVALFGLLIIISSQPLIGNNSIILFAGSAAMMGFSAILALILFVPSALEISKPFLSFGPLKKIYNFIKIMQQQGQKTIPIIHIIILISIANTIVKGLEWYAFGIAVGINFNLPYDPLVIFIVLQALISALQFVPTPTIAGFGLAEGGAAASMMLLGISAELGVAFLLLNRAITTIIDCIGWVELSKITKSAN